MWFRNLQLYRLPENWDLSADTLADKLATRPAPTWKTWLNRRNDVPNGEQVRPVHERSEPAHCEPDSDSCPTTPVQHLTRAVGSPTDAARAEGSSSAKLPFIAVTHHTQSEGEALWKHFVK